MDWGLLGAHAGMTEGELREWMERANRAQMQGDWRECARCCDRVLSEQPQFLPALVTKGVCAFRSGDPTGAVTAFTLATQADGRNAAAYQWLSIVQRSLGDRAS